MGIAPVEGNDLSANHFVCRLLTLLAVTVLPAVPRAAAVEKPSLIVVVGAAGEDEFGKNFESWSQLWVKAANAGGAKSTVIGLGETNSTTDLEQLQKALEAEAKESDNELWIVLLGHGTFDGKEAKFNLRGPDLGTTNFAAWLKPFKRPVAVIDCTSSSATFMTKLSAPGRIIITATRSGYEQNYARLGQFISEAITDPTADLDKDGQVSLLEAFLMASHRVAEFYKGETRLATEHALLDDNGDGLGTPADWFRGVRAVKRASNNATPDGWRANQFFLIRSEAERKVSPAVRAQRDELEVGVAKLREQKSKLDEDEYYRQLEKLALELAKLSAQPAPDVSR
jgi:hypothetical protein